MPDPEETEREALVKLLSGILYGGGSGSMEGTEQFTEYVGEVADAVLAARRLSESEIRREWEYAWAADLPDGGLWTGEHNPIRHRSWGLGFLDWDAKASASVLPTVHRVWRTPAGEWMKEADRG
jgi:hypothetical protein